MSCFLQRGPCGTAGAPSAPADMKVSIIKAVPVMKTSCLVWPPYTSCLDMWTPRVRVEGPGGSLAVPERAQGGGSQVAALLEAREKMSSNSWSSGTSCLGIQNPELSTVRPWRAAAVTGYKHALHAAALAAEELEDLVRSAGLVGPQPDPDVVDAARAGPPHLRQPLWTQVMRTAPPCNANRSERPERESSYTARWRGARPAQQQGFGLQDCPQTS